MTNLREKVVLNYTIDVKFDYPDGHVKASCLNVVGSKDGYSRSNEVNYTTGSGVRTDIEDMGNIVACLCRGLIAAERDDRMKHVQRAHNLITVLLADGNTNTD